MVRSQRWKWGDLSGGGGVVSGDGCCSEWQQCGVAVVWCERLSVEDCCKTMAKHHPDLIMCRKQPGIAIGRLCEKCDGKCVICDSYVRPCTLVRVCDECNYGSFQGRCVICGGVGISDAYYCKECTQQEKDRDGCPKIVNLGSAKTDLFYERKKYGFKKR
ncbi:PHD finger-like domain-containing protein 5B [Bienertia sinuspersici]